MCDMLCVLSAAWDGPWLMIGDFNEALWQHEHFSETPRPERQMVDFKEVLSFCDLHDIGFSGLPWTYNNNQSGQRNVRVRLYRGVVTLLFPDASVNHLTSPRSDHKALLLKLPGDGENFKSARVFRYEIMWDLGSVADALKTITWALQSWSKEKFGYVRKKIEQLRSHLEILEMENPIRNREQILKSKRELDELLYREEMLWLQRSRIMWLKEGDRNTKLFHRKAMWRAKKKKIKKLRRDDGSCQLVY